MVALPPILSERGIVPIRTMSWGDTMKIYHVTMCDGYAVDVKASDPDRAAELATRAETELLSEWGLNAQQFREAITVRSVDLVEV